MAVEVRNLTIPAEEVIGTLTEPLFPNQANPYAKLEKCTLNYDFKPEQVAGNVAKWQENIAVIHERREIASHLEITYRADGWI